jgi:HSP20 family protein
MALHSLIPFRSSGSDPFHYFQREMNRLWDDVMHGAGRAGQNGDASIMVNVSETSSEIKVTAELPGVGKDDVEVELNDEMLIIRGEKKHEHKEEEENFHYIERSFGTFQRSLRLPGAVDPDQVDAHFDNGVLTVKLRKSAQQEKARRIQVKSS